MLWSAGLDVIYRHFFRGRSFQRVENEDENDVCCFYEVRWRRQGIRTLGNGGREIYIVVVLRWRWN